MTSLRSIGDPTQQIWTYGTNQRGWGRFQICVTFLNFSSPPHTSPGLSGPWGRAHSLLTIVLFICHRDRMISYVNEIFEGGNVYELTLENGYNPNLLQSGPRGCGHLHLPPNISICHRHRMIPYVNTLFEGRTLCEIHTIKRLYSTKNSMA